MNCHCQRRRDPSAGTCGHRHALIPEMPVNADCRGLPAGTDVNDGGRRRRHAPSTGVAMHHARLRHRTLPAEVRGRRRALSARIAVSGAWRCRRPLFGGARDRRSVPSSGMPASDARPRLHAPFSGGCCNRPVPAGAARAGLSLRIAAVRSGWEDA